MMSIDVAFPRNEKDWFENLPPEIEDQLEIKPSLRTFVLSCNFTKTIL